MSSGGPAAFAVGPFFIGWLEFWKDRLVWDYPGKSAINQITGSGNGIIQIACPG